MLDRITPLILTFNEAPNITRTLAQLSWAPEIVVVDSGSTDGTLEILARHSNVRVLLRPFTTHAQQWTFGLRETSIATEWVLALDADFVLSDEIVHELSALDPQPEVSGYRASFTYCIEGKPLRSGVYAPIVVLYRRDRSAYVQDGHTQRVHVDGEILPLSARIFHDDRKSLGRWLKSQARYMRLEADKLLAANLGQLTLVNRLRRLILVAPLAVFVHCLFVRGGVLDGKAGLYYALQRTIAEMVLSLCLLRQMILGKDSSATDF